LINYKPLVERYSREVWKHEEERFRELEEAIRIPNARLVDVDMVELSNLADFDQIPEAGGCYWLWTTVRSAETLLIFFRAVVRKCPLITLNTANAKRMDP